MNSKTVLLYPVSVMNDRVAEYLAPFFSDVVRFVPTEDDAVPVHGDFPVNVRTMVPAPLGRRLDGFNMLVRDVKNWGMQLGAGEDLHFENLVAMVEQQEKSESVQAIMKDIKGRKEGRVLAVARLFLRLAMENDRQQMELDRELGASGDAGRVIASILGGDDAGMDDSDLNDVVGSLSGEVMPELSMIRQRIRSWTAIATRYDERALDAVPLGLSSGTKDRMDIAFEALVKRKTLPVELLALRLPASTDDFALLFDSSFRPMWDELMAAAISGPWTTSAIELAASKVQRAWDRRIERKERGGVTLFLTAYPGATCMQLMKKAAGLSDRIRTGFIHKDMNISFFLV